MSKIFLITILFVATVSCKTHIESVTPEYPIEVYEFICKQVDSNILEEIKGSKRGRNYLVIRFQIEKNEIVDVAVLSKVLEDDIAQKIEDELMHKQVYFSFLENKKGSINISGLIKFKKFSMTCISDDSSTQK